MQVTLERRVALALDLVRFEVDHTDVIHRETAALARPDVDQDAVIDADAAMTVVIDDVGPLQHADAIDQLLLQFGLRMGVPSPLQFGCRHSVPPAPYQLTSPRTWLRHRSHARMPAVWLTASASRPSSGSSAAIGAPPLSAPVPRCMRGLTSQHTARNTARWRVRPSAPLPCGSTHQHPAV